MMIVNEDSDFKNRITIKFERAVMSGSIQVKNNFFNSLQTQLSVKNERPARLELVINDKLNILGLLITMHTKRLKLSKKVEGLLKTNFKNKLFNTKINRNVRLAEAPDDGKPAIMYDVNCSGATDYMDLALEIINGKK